MSEKIDNLILEHLKTIQSEVSDLREQNRDILKRLGNLETMVARMGRDLAEMAVERVEDRHTIDRLRERVARIERRLELVD